MVVALDELEARLARPRVALREVLFSRQFSIQEQILSRNVERVRRGLVLKPDRLYSRLESNEEEEKVSLAGKRSFRGVALSEAHCARW